MHVIALTEPGEISSSYESREGYSRMQKTRPQASKEISGQLTRGHKTSFPNYIS